MRIIGAGLAGLLAGNLLRRHEPHIYEAQDTVPSNHGALLRFRSPVVSEATAIPFRKVRVTKGWKTLGPPDKSWVTGANAPLGIANRYSYKVTGEVLPRSIMNLEPSTRYIAPDDFTAALLKGTHSGVTVNYTVSLQELMQDWKGEPIISTIPMPILMKMVGWPDMGDAFRWHQITSVRTRILEPKVNVYQTIYYPGPEPWYRASITGDLLIIEYRGDLEGYDPDIVDVTPDVSQVFEDFGIPATKMQVVQIVRQPFGKLAPVADDSARRAFILAMTDRYGIYSLGRFATWRQLLLDDLAQDIRLIDRMITERDDYGRHLGGIAS